MINVLVHANHKGGQIFSQDTHVHTKFFHSLLQLLLIISITSIHHVYEENIRFWKPFLQTLTLRRDNLVYSAKYLKKLKWIKNYHFIITNL